MYTRVQVPDAIIASSGTEERLFSKTIKARSGYIFFFFSGLPLAWRVPSSHARDDAPRRRAAASRSMADWPESVLGPWAAGAALLRNFHCVTRTCTRACVCVSVCPRVCVCMCPRVCVCVHEPTLPHRGPSSETCPSPNTIKRSQWRDQKL